MRRKTLERGSFFIHFASLQTMILSYMKRPMLLSPQLFDLSRDIVPYIPPELIEEWLKSDRSEQSAVAILESKKVRGTLLSSDTSGLSKLSQKLDVIEVMAYLNTPKEIVYAYGKAIGGIGVGLWAADNTQMFFDETVSTDEILAVASQIQRDIKKYAKVTIGISLHFGEFSRIGNTMYGPQADLAEEVAEEHVAGGEIVVSKSFCNRLTAANTKNLTLRSDISTKYETFYTLEKLLAAKVKKSRDINYPVPFSKEFHTDIRKLNGNDTKSIVEELREKYIQDKVVVLIERERITSAKNDRALLDDLAFYAGMSKVSMQLLNDYEGKRIKTIGNLGIYVFSDEKEAFLFAKDFQHLLFKEYRLRSRIGIDRGEVLIFTLPDGTKEIAGNPVNIASKLAQDTGNFGKMYLSSAIYHKVLPDGFKEGQITASGVEIIRYEG